MSITSIVTDLFVRHKFECRLRSNLKHVDAVAAPQRSHASFYQHVL